MSLLTKAEVGEQGEVPPNEKLLVKVFSGAPMQVALTKIAGVYFLVSDVRRKATHHRLWMALLPRMLDRPDERNRLMVAARLFRRRAARARAEG